MAYRLDLTGKDGESCSLDVSESLLLAQLGAIMHLKSQTEEYGLKPVDDTRESKNGAIDLLNRRSEDVNETLIFSEQNYENGKFSPKRAAIQMLGRASDDYLDHLVAFVTEAVQLTKENRAMLGVKTNKTHPLGLMNKDGRHDVQIITPEGGGTPRIRYNPTPKPLDDRQPE